MRVGKVRPAQRVSYIVRAESLLPDSRFQRAVLIKWLVYYIPLPDLTTEVPDLGKDMLFEDLCKLTVSKRTSGHPGRQLAIPDEIVTTHELMVFPGKLYLGIGLPKGHNAPLSFDRSPLHLVFWR